MILDNIMWLGTPFLWLFLPFTWLLFLYISMTLLVTVKLGSIFLKRKKY